MGTMGFIVLDMMHLDILEEFFYIIHHVQMVHTRILRKITDIPNRSILCQKYISIVLLICFISHS